MANLDEGNFVLGGELHGNYPVRSPQEQAWIDIENRVTKLEALTSPESTLAAINTAQQVEANRVATYKLSEVTEKRLLAIEARQDADDRRHSRVVMAVVGIVAAIGTGALGLELASEEQEQLRSIAYGLLIAGVPGAVALPFAKEREDQG